MSVRSTADMVRWFMGAAPGELVRPRALAKWLTFDLQLTSFGRSELRGKVLHLNDLQSREAQNYQIARMCCAHLLLKLKQIKRVSPHDLAVELCGVSIGLVAVNGGSAGSLKH